MTDDRVEGQAAAESGNCYNFPPSTELDGILAATHQLPPPFPLLDSKDNRGCTRVVKYVARERLNLAKIRNDARNFESRI